MRTQKCAMESVIWLCFKESFQLIPVVSNNEYFLIPSFKVFSMGLIVQYLKKHYCVFYMTRTYSKSKLCSSERLSFSHTFKSSLKNSAEPLQIIIFQHTSFRKRWDFFLSVDTYHTCCDISCFDICIFIMS